MPVMSGLDATRRLRSLGLHIPILALTGNALSEDRQAFLAAGASILLTKPVNQQELRQQIESFLAQSKRPL